jgi:hypothetical protein
VIFSYVWLLKVVVKAKLLFAAESGLVWHAGKGFFVMLLLLWCMHKLIYVRRSKVNRR